LDLAGHYLKWTESALIVEHFTGCGLRGTLAACET
jgi:hypothetical protein